MKKNFLFALMCLALNTTQAQWSLTGNAGTNTTTNFMGTTDNADIVFKRNKVWAGFLSPTNTAFGISALSIISQTAKTENTAIGTSALTSCRGKSNTALGFRALTHLDSALSNSAVGAGCLEHTVSGNYNTATGYLCGYDNVSGSYNTYVGYYVGNGIKTGSANTIIGSRVFNLPAGLSGTVIIADGNGNKRLYIDSVGNAGFGTAIPSARLEINSSIGGRSGLKFTELNSGSATTAANGKCLSVDAAGNVILVPFAPSFWNAATVGANNVINTNAGGVIIGTGISTVPAGYKLYVSNGILTEKIKATLKSSTNWADHVFAGDYKLRPLEEVEAFIKANKHLPGVPSAEQLVQEGGIDMNEMFGKQMEKIEELTLYLLEMKKEIEALKKENKTLRQ